MPTEENSNDFFFSLPITKQKERDTDRQKLLQAYDELSTESRKKLLDYAEDLRNR